MIVERLSRAAWNDLLSTSPYRTVFHDYDWGEVITTHLGGLYRPVIIKNEGKSWLVPFYVGKPWSKEGEQRIGSIGYGGPLPLHAIQNPRTELESVTRLFNKISTDCNVQKIDATFYPARCWEGVHSKGMHLKSTVIIDLKGTPEEIYANVLSGSIRRSLRKSIKANVLITELGNNESAILQAHRLLVQTQQRIGSSYSTPESLFRALCQLKLATTQSQTFLARIEGEIVSVMVMLYNQDEAFYLLHGWDLEYRDCFANQALIWHMIKHASSLGCRRFNMGFSHTDALLQTKLSWGGHIEYLPTLNFRPQSKKRPN